MRADEPTGVGDSVLDGENNALIWDDNVQELWERLRTGPAVRTYGHGHSLMTSPTAVDQYLHLSALASSNPAAVFLGSEAGLIPLQVDPPDHVRYRRMLDPLFTPPKMAALEADVATLVNRRIDGFIERGSCDVASELAVPIPCATFLRLLGLPIERLDEFIVMKDDLIRPVPTDADDATAMRARAGAWVFDLFGEALDQRADHPTDDVIGHLVRLEQRQLAEQPELTPRAVEELLRWMCPVPTVARIFTGDAVVEGCPVRAGTQMSMLLASTNIDPNRFEDPTHVDFTRQSIKHLAFGLGVHRCLGSHLARMELRVTLAEWHRRIPEYSVEPGHPLVFAPGRVG